MNIKLELPDVSDLQPRISVIGIGGAGCNAINNMIATGLEGVEFVAANTDAQALAMSSAEQQIQLGAELTEGLGAGARPEIGRGAAEEAIDEIRAQIEGCHMVFLAAGMGGGTGTGAISVIARIAREMDILTVAIVSKPFQFEGSRRMRTAEDGIKELRDQVDTLIVIPNQNLFRIANQKTTFAEAFILADQVLYSGIACIVDLIVKDGLINLDFADVKAVMKGMGSAMMGTGEATGEDRATLAAEKAVANPLLDEISLRGARGLLISIIGGQNLTLFEVDEAASRVKSEAHPDANIIVGASFEDDMDNKIRVSIVAAGLDGASAQNAQPSMAAVAHAQAASAVSAETISDHASDTSHQEASSPTSTSSTDSAAQDHAESTDSQASVSSERSYGDQIDTSGNSLEEAEAAAEPQAPHDYAASGPEPFYQPIAPASGRTDNSGQTPPPPLPPPVYDDADPYLGDTPAEEFARALDDVIQSVADENCNQRNLQDPTWVSPDGIAIREGLTPSPSGEALPSTHELQPGSAYDGNEFAAQQPADMPRRVPDISQFPPIAQQEFESRKESASPTSNAGQSQSRGVPGLLRRIAGFGRQGSNLTEADGSESQNQPSRTTEQQLHSDRYADSAGGRK